MQRHHWEALELYDGWLRGDGLRPVDASKGWDEAEERGDQIDEFGIGNKNPSKSDIVRVAQLLQIAVDGLCHADPGEGPVAQGGAHSREQFAQPQRPPHPTHSGKHRASKDVLRNGMLE